MVGHYFIIMLEVIKALLQLITPDPAKKDIRLSRAELRLELKKLRVAKRMFRQLEKEFEKDGLTDEERQTLEELSAQLVFRKMELVKI